MRNDERESGFTLLELVVSLALIAMAASVAILNVRQTSGQVRLGPLATQLGTDLKRARTAAMTSNKPVAFMLDPKAHGYRLEGLGRGVTLPRGADLSLAVNRDGPRAADHGQVVFFPDGSATGGQFTLTNSQGESRVLIVQWLTGTVVARGSTR